MVKGKMAEVSGRAFLGMIRFLKDRQGAELVDRAVSEAGKAAQQVFSERIRVTAWFPYTAYVDFMCAIDRLLGSGDNSFCRELGQAAGQRDINTIFRIYLALSSPEKLIRACQKVWPSYHRDAGSMEATEWQPDRTILKIHDFPQMHPAHCRLMEGWMTASMESIGFKITRMEEVKCMSQGDPHHEFFCTWKRD